MLDMPRGYGGDFGGRFGGGFGGGFDERGMEGYVGDDRGLGATTMTDSRFSRLRSPPGLSRNVSDLDNFHLGGILACEEAEHFDGGAFYPAAGGGASAADNAGCGTNADGGTIPAAGRTHGVCVENVDGGAISAAAAAAHGGGGATFDGGAISAAADRNKRDTNFRCGPIFANAAGSGVGGRGATSALVGLSGLDRRIAATEATMFSASNADVATTATAKGNGRTINPENAAGGGGCGVISTLDGLSGLDRTMAAHDSAATFYPATVGFGVGGVGGVGVGAGEGVGGGGGGGGGVGGRGGFRFCGRGGRFGGGDVSEPDASFSTELKQQLLKFDREGSELAGNPAQEAWERGEGGGGVQADSRGKASSSRDGSEKFDMSPVRYSDVWNAGPTEAAYVAANSSVTVMAAMQPPRSDMNASEHLGVLPGVCGDAFSRSGMGLREVRRGREGGWTDRVAFRGEKHSPLVLVSFLLQW